MRRGAWTRKGPIKMDYKEREAYRKRIEIELKGWFGQVEVRQAEDWITEDFLIRINWRDEKQHALIMWPASKIDELMTMLETY